jgi:hypothetical protein
MSWVRAESEGRTDPPRGLLNLDTADGRIHLARYVPAKDIGFYVEHY